MRSIAAALRRHSQPEAEEVRWSQTQPIREVREVKYLRFVCVRCSGNAVVEGMTPCDGFREKCSSFRLASCAATQPKFFPNPVVIDSPIGRSSSVDRNYENVRDRVPEWLNQSVAVGEALLPYAIRIKNIFAKQHFFLQAGPRGSGWAGRCVYLPFLVVSCVE